MSVEQQVGIVIYTIQLMAGMLVITSIWTRSKKSASLTLLTALQATVMAWLLCAIIENLVRGTPVYPFFVRRILVVLYFLAPLWLLFTFAYLDLPLLRSRKARIGVLMPSVVLALYTLITPASPWIIREMDGNTQVAQWGSVFIASTFATYLVGLLCAALLVFRTWRTRRNVRENLLLAISALVPILLSILVNLRIIQPPVFDLTPISLSFFIGVIALLAYRHKLLDRMPHVARELLASFTEAILILDPDGNIVDYNNAFRSLFSPLVDLDGCRTVMDIRARLPEEAVDVEAVERFRQTYKAHNPDHPVVFQVRTGEQDRTFSCVIDPLVDNEKQEVGRLLAFHDITALRDQTLLSERKRVSGDLHDSLGNSLNIIGSNLEYALRLQPDQPEIRRCLQVSYERSTRAILDLRRIVDALSPVDVAEHGLTLALENLIARTRRQGVHITFDHLVSAGKEPDRILHPEHLYYICQEALHNAVEHGRPETIQVVLKQNPDDLRLYISDDGAGCK
ncbi:MAG: PAS domain-containing protein, partial [Clostridiaceae bacterium]|nr:PAS domain-containing protein [Clostridiaceae bacterium]